MIIQGLYGSGKELAEEATEKWTHKYLKSFSLGSRLMLFEWESHNVFAGTETRSVIGALSRCLLQGLANIGGEESMVCAFKYYISVLKLTKGFCRNDPSCS